MNVLFIANDPHIGEEGSSVRARMRSYASAIGNLHILTRAKEEGVIQDGALTIHTVAYSKITGWRAFARHANTIIMQDHIEVVSCQDPFEYGLVGVRAIKGTTAKLHIQVHTDFLSPWFTRANIFRSPIVSMPAKNALRRRIASYVLPRAHGIRAVSERVRDSLVRFYGDTISVPTVLPIVPSLPISPKVAFPCSTFPFTLVTVGRLEPEKRIDDIFEALARLREAYPQVGLVVIGKGREQERLAKKVEELELTGKVVFVGSQKEAWGMMQSAQAYIQASAYEGYGITLIEAALARVPIITSDVGVVGEVLRGFEDVLVSPPGDPTNLAYHIISLIEDPASKEVRVRSAEHQALEHVTRYQNLPELIARDLEAIKGV